MVIPKKNKTGFYIFFSIIGLFLFAIPGIPHALPSNKIIQTRFTTGGKNNGEIFTITLKQNPRFKYLEYSDQSVSKFIDKSYFYDTQS